MYNVQTLDGATLAKRDSFLAARRFAIQRAPAYPQGLQVVEDGKVIATATFSPEDANGPEAEASGAVHEG